GGGTADERIDEVVEQQYETDTHDCSSDGGEQVHEVKTDVRLERLDAARHAHEAEEVLREEDEVEAGYQEPEGPLAERFAHHASRHLRQPVVGRADEGEQRSATHHVMEVGNDEVRVVHLLVNRRNSDHDAGDSAQEEGD